MANGPNYRVPLRRRREGRTNYYKRRDMLKSNRIRLVIRKSTNNITVQFVKALPDGDATLSATTTYHLTNFGWDITKGNIPAAYLVGYLAGKKARNANIDNAILDLGVQTSQSGSRIYATLKGVIDAGVNVPANESIFPEDDIIHGTHIANYSVALKSEDSKLYKTHFAGYLNAKKKPEDLAKYVDKTIKAIDKEFKE